MRVRAAIAAAACACLAAQAAVDADAMNRRPRPRPKKIAGTVRVVGSEPFPKTVITVFHGGVPSDCLVEGPLEKVLRDGHQGRNVVVEGSACPHVPPGFADCIVPTKILPAE